MAYLKREYIQTLLKGYDYLAVLTNVQNTHSAVRSAELCKEISPRTKTLAYGPACYYLPQYFEKHPFDGCVVSGDPELALESYIDYQRGDIGKEALLGIATPGDEQKSKPGDLPPERWAFPPLDKLPLESYDNIVSKKEAIKKFGDRQISVTVSRGCPYNCEFCFATLMFGIKERRRPIPVLLDYLEENREKFSSVQMFSPNFTLDKKWVFEFCNSIKERGLKFDWRCTTRAELIDSQIAQAMFEVGCKSVGIGVETLQTDIQQGIHKIQDQDRVLKSIRVLRESGINPKGYIMLGLPGQTKKDVYQTIRLIKQAGGEVRPSSYSPYQQLDRNSTLSDISEMNRYTYNIDSVKGLSPAEYLSIILNRDFTEGENED